MESKGILSDWARNYLAWRGFSLFVAIAVGAVFFLVLSNADQVYIVEKDTACTKSESFAKEMRLCAEKGDDSACHRLLRANESLFTLAKGTAVILEEVERFDICTIARAHFDGKEDEHFWMFVRHAKRE